MTLIHERHDISHPTLDGYRNMIVAEVDGVALRVGRLLREARQACPEDFERWIEQDLPFGRDTAKRLMAISAAYEKLPDELTANLPRPWQAMYAIKELPQHALQAGIDRGVLGPSTSVREAIDFARAWRNKGEVRPKDQRQVRAEAHAGALMAFPPDVLSPTIRTALQTWLGRGTAPRP